ncbi:DUF4433 domain-containing protein [Fibrella sp. HMF5335]|uniref:DUF4433 domain-containing protein n=1 Tax=Fibrella rubiginis TaxID=2817060 RepID=A0A939K4R8_9BACT|nr:DarT ssDNA thymidine ADP-ribosyltransferase family protein [Fibrella rubiginis]MBO0936998.1 DUF4433 domain-containing protein [Fibrella rubiginis]
MEIVIFIVIVGVLSYLYLEEEKRKERQRWAEWWEEERERQRLQTEREKQKAECLRQRRIDEEKERVRQQAEQERRVQQDETAEREREAAQRSKQEVEARRKREAEQQIQAQIQATERARVEKEKTQRAERQLLQLNLSSERKNNYEKFAQVLQENSILTLYHFTDRANISSIKENGALLSWWYCEQNDINILKPGSDETSKSLDRHYNLQDYVRLSFTPNHPMMYVAKLQGRIQDPVVLKINPEICFFQETKFSDMNATKTGHKCGPTIEDLMRIRFAVVKQNTHFNLSDEDKPHYQAEVLVKTRLPIEWITNINAF